MLTAGGTHCVRCRRSRHDDGGPVTWRCQMCGGRVCRNCALVVPGSSPPEYYEVTLCSEACRDKGKLWLRDPSLKKPEGIPVTVHVVHRPDLLHSSEEDSACSSCGVAIRAPDPVPWTDDLKSPMPDGYVRCKDLKDAESGMAHIMHS